MDIGIRADGLNTTDFENFAIELTKVAFNSKTFHGFKEGKDEGIDGIDNSTNPTLILQAKRWGLNKSSNTAVELIKKEIGKIYQKKIKEEWCSIFKYVLVTSMDFSHNQVKEIRTYANEIMPHSMPSDDCIIFASTFNTLAHNPKYVTIFENYGLLQTNLSKILSERRIKSIETESKDFFLDINPYYIVETEFIDKAYYILKETHIILVQGPAGIGKTTTCILLGNLFINNSDTDMSLVNRKIEDIDKIIEMYNNDFKDNYNKSLFVVLDDFLGKNFFDVGERRLMDIQKLYSAAKYSQNLFICLNSRTQILSEANTLNYDFKKLIEKKFIHNNNIVIDLSEYSDIDKANILRKKFELKYHELDIIGREQLSKKYDELRNGDYFNIINHRNYYPRLIELIVDNFLLADGDFLSYIREQLNNPSRIYEELFEHLTSEEKKLLVSVLMFHRRPIAVRKVTLSLEYLGVDYGFNVERSLEKLNGSWITFSTKNLSDERYVDFLNPSIVDFFNSNLSYINSLKKQVFDNTMFISQVIPNYKEFNYDNFELVDDDFYTKILNKSDFWVDKSDYDGEMIIAILKSKDFGQHNLNFQNNLASYKGEFNSSQYSCGWEKVIDAIYYADLPEAWIFFLDLLDNKNYVKTITTGNYVDLYSLNNILDSIQGILDRTQYENKNYPELVTELSNYRLLENRAAELVQEKLDNYDTVENYEVNDVTNDDFKDIVLQDTVAEVFLLKNNFNLNYFDLSTLEENIKLYEENNEFDDNLNTDTDNYKHASVETISEIINRPLSNG